MRIVAIANRRGERTRPRVLAMAPSPSRAFDRRVSARAPKEAREPRALR